MSTSTDRAAARAARKDKKETPKLADRFEQILREIDAALAPTQENETTK